MLVVPWSVPVDFRPGGAECGRPGELKVFHQLVAMGHGGIVRNPDRNACPDIQTVSGESFAEIKSLGRKATTFKAGAIPAESYARILQVAEIPTVPYVRLDPVISKNFKKNRPREWELIEQESLSALLTKLGTGCRLVIARENFGMVVYDHGEIANSLALSSIRRGDFYFKLRS